MLKQFIILLSSMIILYIVATTISNIYMVSPGG